MASREWPATLELRRLLEGLLDEAPAGAERVVLVQALGLLSDHELVPRVWLSARAPLPTDRKPEGAPS